MKFTIKNNTARVISIPRGPGGKPLRCLPGQETPADFAGNAEAANRFQRELRTAAVQRWVDNGDLRIVEGKSSPSAKATEDFAQVDSGTTGGKAKK